MNDTALEREVMEYDVIIVGAGPAGLACAIRLKQLKTDLTVAVIEKGAEVDQAETAVRLAKQAGLVVRATFILGLPGETREDSEATIAFAAAAESARHPLEAERLRRRAHDTGNPG